MRVVNPCLFAFYNFALYTMDDKDGDLFVHYYFFWRGGGYIFATGESSSRRSELRRWFLDFFCVFGFCFFLVVFGVNCFR